MKTITLIIPAHNEETRIARTLNHYYNYFYAPKQKTDLTVTFLVVLNGCTDQTKMVVTTIAQQKKNIYMHELPTAGKGRAITIGFQKALTYNTDLIGFVDADMATEPCYFHDLIRQISKSSVDGVIASRYMPQSHTTPTRPWIKTWGRKIVWNRLIRLLFKLKYHDLQCGAKLFTHTAIKQIADKLTITQWALDVELLYLCKKNKFTIVEIPTKWHDQQHSKLKIFGSGIPMLGELFRMWWYHSIYKKKLHTKEL